MSKIDFKDVTFIIPIKFDSADRRTNFKTTIGYLERNFDTNIIVMESDTKSNEDFVKSVSDNIQYIFDDKFNGSFHRTRLLNHMTKESKTNILVNYDVDVIFPISQYLESKKKVEDGATIVYPYGGKFYDVKKPMFKFVEEDKVSEIDLKKCQLFNANSVGGAIFFDKERYWSIGLENENFISWGYEDWERLRRVEKLGHTAPRITGVLYHLTHSRNKDGSGSNPHYRNNGKLYGKIKNMNKNQLLNHINTWTWIKKEKEENV